MTTATKISVKTNSFVASHGREPRPLHYGLWMFYLESPTGEQTAFQATDTYRGAIRQAREAALEIGAISIIVGS